MAEVVHILASLPEYASDCTRSSIRQCSKVGAWQRTAFTGRNKAQRKGSSQQHRRKKKALVNTPKSQANEVTKMSLLQKSLVTSRERDCRKFLASQKRQQGAHARTAETKRDEEGPVTVYSLAATSTGSCIVDSGATCHMSNNKDLN